MDELQLSKAFKSIENTQRYQAEINSNIFKTLGLLSDRINIMVKRIDLVNEKIDDLNKKLGGQYELGIYKVQN